MPKKTNNVKIQMMVPKKSLGGLLGRLAGGIGSSLFPIAGVNGAELGQSLGSMLPFRRGGAVKAKKRGGALKARKRGGM